YRLKGPPHFFMRALAPLLVASTLMLFGTGIAFLVVGHGGWLLLTVHAASFVVWGALVAVHKLVYLRSVLTEGIADWRPRARRPDGSILRRSVVVVALAGGVAVGIATYSVQTGWLAHRHHHHQHALRAPARD